MAAGLIGLCLSHPVAASPIRHQSQAQKIQTEWNNFLAGGPTLWGTRHAPPITALIKRESHADLATADPLSLPMVQYLEWRRDLNPARFDHFHPFVGPILQSLLPPPTTVNPQPQELPPQFASVPEPGTISIALGLLAAGAFGRRRSRRPDPRNRT